VKKIISLVSILVLAFFATQPANAKDLIAKKNACPNTNFERFIETATALEESAGKYATGKVRVVINAMVEDDGFEEYRQVVQMTNPKRVDLKFIKAPGPENNVMVTVSQYRLNKFRYTFNLQDSDVGAELRFERHSNCFRYVEYIGMAVPDQVPDRPYFPKHMDPAVRYFLRFAPASLTKWDQIGQWPSKGINYSRRGRKFEGAELELVGRVYTKPGDLKKLKKFPFAYPIDKKLWQLGVSQESPTEVAITFSEILAEPNATGRTISYYFTSSGGIMWLTEIVDKFGLLDL
jgi:hypothetical protein